MVEQQPVPSAQLDHIIILLPHRDLLDPPPWITSNFTLSPGGRHADGKTENKLIVFQDGTYIELIAFIDDSPAYKDGHWWGDKRYGVIDWALTSSDVQDVSRVSARLDEWRGKQRDGGLTAFAYTRPQPGGRRRPDGQEIAWFVTFPEGVRRGVAPFWCHDVTARGLRVSASAQGLLHPCGALGVSNIAVQTPDSARLHGAYDAILARPGNATADRHGFDWIVEAPQVLAAYPTPKVTLRPRSGDQQENDSEARITIELVVEPSSGSRVQSPIDERVGSRGEGHIEISFLSAEKGGPQ
ncbi:glyoxalase bleomycin resistance protein dioxygenase superfamily [Diplodia corticola]|uniref:Glyoxalase bleomycin resistance protein dioxygenase superfamily n=1 Tax=Diplodia corticola TaxID=236234 RepID=A0A1J9R5A7_9PEZI|nr:glyoxalase bleomycin resistance protein dioxygenase superfamily [Diplodia corticola]OJD35410.1 glyoxalase bleomycin resistance protein dioxygenase superfamily [Diplodia corticola]